MSIPFDSPYAWDLVEVPTNPSISSSTSPSPGGTNVRFTVEQGSELYVYNQKNSFMIFSFRLSWLMKQEHLELFNL